MRNLKSKINKQNRNRLTDTENRLTAGRGRGVGGMGEMVKRLSKQRNKKHHRHRQECGNYQRERGVEGDRTG